MFKECIWHMTKLRWILKVLLTDVASQINDMRMNSSCSGMCINIKGEYWILVACGVCCNRKRDF